MFVPSKGFPPKKIISQERNNNIKKSPKRSKQPLEPKYRKTETLKNTEKKSPKKILGGGFVAGIHR